MGHRYFLKEKMSLTTGGMETLTSEKLLRSRANSKSVHFKRKRGDPCSAVDLAQAP